MSNVSHLLCWSTTERVPSFITVNQTSDSVLQVAFLVELFWNTHKGTDNDFNDILVWCEITLLLSLARRIEDCGQHFFDIIDGQLLTLRWLLAQ
jgi:hypothetical protein